MLEAPFRDVDLQFFSDLFGQVRLPLLFSSSGLTFADFGGFASRLRFG